MWLGSSFSSIQESPRRGPVSTPLDQAGPRWPCRPPIQPPPVPACRALPVVATGAAAHAASLRRPCGVLTLITPFSSSSMTSRGSSRPASSDLCCMLRDFLSPLFCSLSWGQSTVQKCSPSPQMAPHLPPPAQIAPSPGSPTPLLGSPRCPGAGGCVASGRPGHLGGVRPCAVKTFRPACYC